MVWQIRLYLPVSAADYYIAGVKLTSAEQTTTLGVAHTTLDRIDVIALDTAGAVVVLPGTRPRRRRSRRSIRPSTKLAIVLVAHATTTPPDLETVVVYAEDVGPPTEWTWISSGASIDVNSTQPPHCGLQVIEGQMSWRACMRRAPRRRRSIRTHDQLCSLFH